jgi:hypothetical protein
MARLMGDIVIKTLQDENGNSLIFPVSPVLTIADYTHVGGAATAINFTGLDFTVDGGYRILVSGSNSSGAPISIGIMVQNDQVPGNYSSHYFNLSLAVVSGINIANNYQVAPASNGFPYFFESVFFPLRPGQGNAQPAWSFISRFIDAAGFVTRNGVTRYNNALNNITQIGIVSGTAATLENGTRIQIFKNK